MTDTQQMSYANYGIDVEEIDKLVRSALAGGQYRFPRNHLQAYGYEFDDLHQQAMMYVYKYSAKYDAEAGMPSTYIYRTVKSAVWHLMAYYTRKGRRDAAYATISIDRPLFAESDGDSADMLNYLGSEDFPEIAADLDYIAVPMSHRFGEVMTNVFIDIYSGDGSIVEHAEALGTNRKALSQRLNVMKHHMRHILRQTGDYAKCA